MRTPNGMIMAGWRLVLGYLSIYAGVALTIFAFLALRERYEETSALLLGFGLYLFATLGTAVVSYGLGWYERGEKDGTTGKDW